MRNQKKEKKEKAKKSKRIDDKWKSIEEMRIVKK